MIIKLHRKTKTFTYYDDVDNLKRMKDSDILAEKKRNSSIVNGDVVRNTVVGAAGVGAAGALTGGILGSFTPRPATAAKGFRGLPNAIGRGMSKGVKRGALIGAGIAAAATMARNRKQANENAKYNKNLKYAQGQAKRRFDKDWKTNMTQRDGYSF